MPKFLVTSGSHFQPFTYDELSKPVMQAVEAHNAAQDAYDTLSDETAALERYITNNPEDSMAREWYDNYMQKLNSLQENLWANGYNASTQRDLRAARNGYFRDITRIASAIKKRQEAGSTWSKMKLEHPELIMEDNPANVGLNSYLMDDNFGSNFYTYNGKTFAEEVSVDVAARGNELIRRPEVMRDPDLVGRIITKMKTGFTNEEQRNASGFVRGVISADRNGLKKSEILSRALDLVDSDANIGLTPEEKLLAGALLSRLNTTGAADRVSDSEFNRLLGYGDLGISAASVSTNQKPEVQSDLEWEQQQKANAEERRHKNALSEIAARKGGTTNGGGTNGGNIRPQVARLVGNNFEAIKDKTQRKELQNKRSVRDALNTLNELKKGHSLFLPDGKTLSDAANRAFNVLVYEEGVGPNRKVVMNPYYEQLTQGKDHFIEDSNLDDVIAGIDADINSMVQNTSTYSFDVKPEAASNMASNIFKLNIGSLRGKGADSVAEQLASYDGHWDPSGGNGNKNPVKASDLMKLLEAPNLNIGFDGKTGNIVIQRKGADTSDERGKYDDRPVYLNTDYVVNNVVAYGNKAAILYAYDMTVPNGVPANDKKKWRDAIENMANQGMAVPMKYMAKLLKSNYKTLVEDGEDWEVAIYNSLVEAFGVGLFMAANTSWAPNYFKEGWSAKTGGELLDEEDYDDLDVFYDGMYTGEE